MASALSLLSYPVTSPNGRQRYWLRSRRKKKAQIRFGVPRGRWRVPEVLPRGASRAAATPAGSCGLGGHRGLPAPAAALPKSRKNPTARLFSAPTLNKVAVHPPTPCNDARKKKIKKKKRRKYYYVSHTICTQIYFLSFKSAAILSSGKVLSWKGFKNNVAFPYVSGNTFYGNLSDCLWTKPTFLDIDKSLLFFTCYFIQEHFKTCY